MLASQVEILQLAEIEAQRRLAAAQQHGAAALAAAAAAQAQHATAYGLHRVATEVARGDDISDVAESNLGEGGGDGGTCEGGVPAHTATFPLARGVPVAETAVEGAGNGSAMARAALPAEDPCVGRPAGAGLLAAAAQLPVRAEAASAEASAGQPIIKPCYHKTC